MKCAWRLTEKNGLGLFNGLTETTKWQMVETSVELFGCVEEVHEQRSLQRTTVYRWKMRHASISRRFWVSKHHSTSSRRARLTYGQRELTRMPSRAWTMASSRVMASTAPLEAVSVTEKPNDLADGSESQARQMQREEEWNQSLTGNLRSRSTHDSNEGCSVDDGASDVKTLGLVGFVLHSWKQNTRCTRISNC